MQTCAICGKSDSPESWEQAHVNEHKLPHGVIHLCTSTDCQNKLILNLFGAVPVAWLEEDDLYYEDGDEVMTEHLSKEEMENLSEDDFVDFAMSFQQALCDDPFSYSHAEAVADTARQWREEKEHDLIENTPKEELPLLIGHLQYDRNTTFLEKRLKGEE